MTDDGIVKVLIVINTCSKLIHRQHKMLVHLKEMCWVKIDINSADGIWISEFVVLYSNDNTLFVVHCLDTVYCKSYEVEKFCAVEMIYNSQKDIRNYMVVSCGLHRGIITISL